MHTQVVKNIARHDAYHKQNFANLHELYQSKQTKYYTHDMQIIACKRPRREFVESGVKHR